MVVGGVVRSGLTVRQRKGEERRGEERKGKGQLTFGVYEKLILAVVRDRHRSTPRSNIDPALPRHLVDVGPRFPPRNPHQPAPHFLIRLDCPAPEHLWDLAIPVHLAAVHGAADLLVLADQIKRPRPVPEIRHQPHLPVARDVAGEGPDGVVFVGFVGDVGYAEGELDRGQWEGGRCDGAVELIQGSEEARPLVAFSVEFRLDDVELEITTYWLASVSCLTNREER